jgi:DNA polymerase elongation subunit (family B)
MEKYYRKPVVYNEKVIQLQTLEWLEFNEIVDEEQSDEEEPSFFDPTNEKYIIRAFGVTADKTSVCVNILNFTPFIFVKVESNWAKKDTDNLINNIIDIQTRSKQGRLWNSMRRYTNCFVRDKCITMKRHDYSEFTGFKQYTFLRLVFNNSQALSACARLINDHNNQKCKIDGIKYKLKIYEANLPGMLRFFHLKEIKPSGWISISNFKVENIKESKCQIEITTDWKNVNYLECENSAPFLQASFDIETFSGDLHSFPIPTNKTDCVITIATTFKYYTEQDFFVKHVLTLKKCAELTISEGVPVVVESFDNEKDLLLAWKRLMVKMDPDVIYGYNSDSFDCWYLWKRAELLNIIEPFKEISRLYKKPAKLEEKSFASSGRGTTEFRRLDIPGRINFDILIFIKIEYKLISYKLNDVSKLYLHDNKVDMNIKEMFKMFDKGDPDDIKLITDYCIKDTCLPQKLVDKLLIMQTQISMSNVTYVPIKYLIERGQQIKTFSLLVKFANSKNFLVPTLYSNYSDEKPEQLHNFNIDDDSDNEEDTGKFTGATVLPPKSDAYYEPITTLDFKSLYPSIMMAHNLCHSTLVKKDKYLNLPNFKYETIEWDDLIKDDKKKPILDEHGQVQYFHHCYTYAVRDIDEKIQGILPKILEGLVNARQEYKDLMKAAFKAGNKDLGNVYNTSQLAVKVTMNSIYGFLGAQMLPEKKIAATVTAKGRDMIANTKNFLETNYLGAEIVYGDSVTGDTPILLKSIDPQGNETEFIECIENINSHGNDVGEWIEYPGFKVFNNELTGKEFSLSDLYVYSKSGWTKIKKIIRHYTNKRLYSVSNETGYVQVTEDHSLLNEFAEIIKPNECTHDTKLLTGYPYSGNRNKISQLLGYTENQLDAAKIFYQYKKLGYSNIFVRKIDNTFEITSYNQINGTLINCMTGNKMNYVYDIETEDGSFQAGIGNIIVKNTDSCFVKFNTKLQQHYTKECDRINNLTIITQNDRDYLGNLKVKLIGETMELGKRAAQETTNSLFKYPISLEYEKVNMPCILLSKKRYIMNKYEDSPDVYKESSSGIILNRRDNFKLVKNLYRNIVNILLNMINKDSKDKEKIVELINKTIQDILDKKIDINELMITKTYKPVKKNENLPQIALVRKIEKRDPGNAPRYNDKINYVIIDTGEIKPQPQYLKSESPEYALEHNLNYDAEYYIKFLMKPICELLNFYFDNPEDIFKKPLKEHKEKRKAILQKHLGIEPKKTVVKKKINKVNRIQIKNIPEEVNEINKVKEARKVIRLVKEKM